MLPRLTVAILLVLAAPAAAADGEGTALNLPATEAAKETSKAAGGGSLIRTIFALVVVVAVIYGVQWLLKRTKGGGRSSGGAALETVTSVALGGNRSLQLVRAGDELLLVGVADHGVTHLRTYTEDEADALGLLPASTSAAPSTSTAVAVIDRAEPAPRPVAGLLAALREKTVLR